MRERTLTAVAWSCIFSFGYDRIFRNLRAAAVLFRAVRGGSYGNYFTDHGTDLCKSDGTSLRSLFRYIRRKVCRC